MVPIVVIISNSILLDFRNDSENLASSCPKLCAKQPNNITKRQENTVKALQELKELFISSLVCFLNIQFKRMNFATRRMLLKLNFFKVVQNLILQSWYQKTTQL